MRDGVTFFCNDASHWLCANLESALGLLQCWYTGIAINSRKFNEKRKSRGYWWRSRGCIVIVVTSHISWKLPLMTERKILYISSSHVSPTKARVKPPIGMQNAILASTLNLRRMTYAHYTTWGCLERIATYALCFPSDSLLSREQHTCFDDTIFTPMFCTGLLYQRKHVCITFSVT